MTSNGQHCPKAYTTMNSGLRASFVFSAALALAMLGPLPLASAASAAPAALAAAVAGVPAHAASASMPRGPASAPGMRGKKVPPTRIKRIDINSASRKELKTLPGIGDAEADRIIAGRPYLSKAELANRSVLPVGPYLSIKNQIIALQKNPPKAKP
jgi:hypothetical protein